MEIARIVGLNAPMGAGFEALRSGYPVIKSRSGPISSGKSILGVHWAFGTFRAPA